MHKLKCIQADTHVCVKINASWVTNCAEVHNLMKGAAELAAVWFDTMVRVQGK